MAYYLYLLFIISYFLHLGARIPVLGAIRFDLGLVVLIFGAIFLAGKRPSQPKVGSTNTILAILGAYVVLTIPLVRWPGSVLNTGIPNFIKAVVFFYYTVALIDSPKKLRVFVWIFVLCQLFRVVEPYYLHVTQGYWGSSTTMTEEETMDRLSGAPFDVVNPNGLAFVITSVYPFLHYLSFTRSVPARLLYWASLPVLLQSLVLTASRTGFLAFGIIMFGIFMKSRKKALLLIVFVVGAGIVYGTLGELQKDRFLSIYRTDVPGAETAQGRNEAVWHNFAAGMARPIFGHGLGTSTEVNANLLGRGQPAHNLYAETFQELGALGLIIVVALVVSIFANFRHVRRDLARIPRVDPYYTHVANAMEVWLLMNLLFSWASYGLSSYEWYLFAGLSVVFRRFAAQAIAASAAPVPPEQVPCAS
ncbi:MAG TPA: O-antigen ligase family protein [Candidatus Eisenbacteria bacterium]|nr:O-antigen ligase family protein [Candidatus Eisenbacteria bacterium]